MVYQIFNKNNVVVYETNLFGCVSMVENQIGFESYHKIKQGANANVCENERFNKLSIEEKRELK